MILAVDAYYNEATSSAKVAGVLFQEASCVTATSVFTTTLSPIVPYESGAFYKRELPCIEALLKILPFSKIDMILVDGYVDLDWNKPGLGRRLYDRMHGVSKIIGVSKTKFKDARGTEVRRFGTKPLYVTSVGLPEYEAAQFILDMSGPYRIPTMLKLVDGLTRS